MATQNKKTPLERIDCSKPGFKSTWERTQSLTMQYNNTPPQNEQACRAILDELLGSCGKNVSIAPGFNCDQGSNIHIGDNSEINYKCTILDCCPVVIGKNVLIAPNVQLYTASHPIKHTDRITDQCLEHGLFGYCEVLAGPITIGDNAWIGGGSIILPGVTIGQNSTIGAGSVVTQSIPENSLAYGNPCRVIRKI